MMIRPPTTSSGGAAGNLMIRPRGVDEKEADSEASEPAEPAKTP